MKDSKSIPLQGCIFDIKRYAIHDGPGIRMNVFFKGCPLYCHWCHNPEGQDPNPVIMFTPSRCLGCGACEDHTHPEECPSGALETCGRYMTVEEVLELALREKIFFDRSGGGITCTGGEPLMQPDFLIGLLSACRKNGIHTTVDTCLQAPELVVRQVIPHTDLFLADVKIMDPALHKKYTGTDNMLIHCNLRTIARSGVPFALRIPLIRGINDTQAELEAMTAFALELRELGRLTNIHLLPYHNYGKEKRSRIYRGRLPVQGDFSAPTAHKLQSILKDLRSHGFHAVSGG